MIHHTSRHFPCRWFHSKIETQPGTDLCMLRATKRAERSCCRCYTGIAGCVETDHEN
jgi:hypothetical protein